MAKPHALKGKQTTAPHASHDPLRILLMDSQRIAAIVVIRNDGMIRYRFMLDAAMNH